MGIGKTAQVSVYLKGLFGGSLIKKALIIVPTTLKSYWKQELKVWCPGIPVRILDSKISKDRGKIIQKMKKKGGILITSYGMITTARMHITEIRYDCMIMDEGHKAKNVDTELRRNTMSISVKSHKLLLSGTPLQNRLEELWSVFDFVQPKLLGTQQTFVLKYAEPIEAGLTKDCTVEQREKSKYLSSVVRKIYQAHFLRRTKKQIFKIKSVEETGQALEDNELPLKTDMVVWLPLTQAQKDIYEMIISKKRVKDMISGSDAFYNAFNYLQFIKKLCQHPLLLKKQVKTKKRKSKVDPELLKQYQAESNQKDLLHTLGLEVPLKSVELAMKQKRYQEVIESSSKLIFMLHLLKKLKAEGHRPLIFSHSKVLLNIFEEIVTNMPEYKELPFFRIDGDVDVDERDKLCKEFNRNTKIFMGILTTGVAGCGLNLVGADRVIIFDPDWNPATDNQAVDRIYRIGQKKDVIVYRLVTIGGIEERIYRRQVHKQGMNKITIEASE